jgi:hypothetical protein
MPDTVTEQIVRESPEIEAYRLGLLDLAKARGEVPVNIPNINVAGMTQDQLSAIEMGRAGLGGYEQYLQNAQGYLGDSASGYGQVAGLAQGYANDALANSQNLGFDTLGQVQGGIGGANALATGAAGAGLNIANNTAGAAQTQASGAAGQASGIAGGAAGQANALAGMGVGGLQSYMNPALAQGQFQGAGAINTASGIGSLASQYAAQGGNAAGIASNAAGLGTGLGIAGASAYDPNRVGAFMDPWQQQVTQQKLMELQRQADIGQSGLAAQAVKAGAFGGSREGIQREELRRNLMTEQNKVLAQDASQNYGQALGASINTFQNDAARLQNAGNMAMQGGQLASGAGLSAAQLGASTNSGLASLLGGMGMNYAQMLQSGGLQAGQLYGNQMQNAAGTALQGGQLGANTALQGGQLASNATLQGGQLATNAALQGGQLAAGTAMQGSQLYNSAGMGLSSLMAQSGLQAGQLTAGAQLDASRGIGSLGQLSGQLGGMDQAYGQADSSFLYNLGANQQKQTQAEYDAQRATTLAREYEPFQRIGFISDIYSKTPTSQQSLSTASAPDPSPFSQIIGAGIAGYGAINAYNTATKTGAFGT